MKRVLILCTGNSCRSQMAQALWQHAADGGWTADSAGSAPSGYVHPLAIEAMAEIDIDISSARSTHVDEYSDTRYDLVVTVCDNAKDSCPHFANAAETHHWPFYDPAEASGSKEEQLLVFRDVRDQISEKINSYLAEQSK